MDLGPPELLIILILVLVLFGGAKLPKLARSLGEARNELKKGLDGETEASSPVATATKPAPATRELTDNVTLTRAEYDALQAARGDAGNQTSS